jgi:hypothetical protein
LTLDYDGLRFTRPGRLGNDTLYCLKGVQFTESFPMIENTWDIFHLTHTHQYPGDLKVEALLYVPSTGSISESIKQLRTDHLGDNHPCDRDLVTGGTAFTDQLDTKLLRRFRAENEGESEREGNMVPPTTVPSLNIMVMCARNREEHLERSCRRALVTTS